MRSLETLQTAPSMPRPRTAAPPRRASRAALLGFGGPATTVGAWILLYLCLGAILRAFLLGAHASDVAFTPGHLLATFARGLTMDFVALAFLASPAVLWMVLLPAKWQCKRVACRGRLACFTLSLFGLFYLAAVEIFFFDEFLARFNYIAVDYLLFPHEVFVNIWQSYPVVPVLAVCLALATGLGWTLRRPILSPPTVNWTKRARVATLGLGFLALAASAQVGMESTSWSGNRVLDEIASNGAYSFAYALRNAGLDFDQFYQTMDDKAAWAEVHRSLGSGQLEDRSTRRFVPGRPGAEPLNVVFIIEESLGSEFSRALGGRYDATPQLDRLMQEGMVFDHVFATGNRTIRGLEAALVSLPPLPGSSVVKRDRSQGLATLASTLKTAGYSTTFLYGGRGYFDNMAAFMLANGFDRFIEQADFEEPTFTTAWGVCDEDLFDRALSELDALDAGDAPFFATLLTVSNHKPYTYPPGRIAEDPREQTRLNAVKYADHALGRFFDEAARRAYFEHTLFVVFGDHGARVYGAERIPLPSYRIPLLMLGPKTLPAGTRTSVLGSSMDVTPTVLDILGLRYESVFYGKSLVAAQPAYDWVLMQHNRDLALFDGSRMVVLGLKGSAEAYDVGDDDSLTEVKSWTPELRAMRRQAVAVFQTAHELYMERRYRIESPTLVAARPAPAADPSLAAAGGQQAR